MREKGEEGGGECRSMEGRKVDRERRIGRESMKIIVEKRTIIERLGIDDEILHTLASYLKNNFFICILYGCILYFLYFFFFIKFYNTKKTLINIWFHFNYSKINTFHCLFLYRTISRSQIREWTKQSFIFTWKCTDPF